MINLVVSLFVLTALALIFAQAWNLLAVTMFSMWEITDEAGRVKKPIVQSLVYAISVSILAIAILYILTRKKFGLDLNSSVRQKSHN